MGALKIGFAQTDFTPELLPMIGNFRSDYYAVGVHDPLTSTAFVFADRSEKVVLLTVDVCMLNRENVDFMRQYIAGSIQIPGGNILIAATHTHSGPATFYALEIPDLDPEKIKEFLKKAAAAAIEAYKNLENSTLHIAFGNEERVSFNRRIRCTDQKIHPNWEQFPDNFAESSVGPIDPEIATMLVEKDDVIKAVIVNFGLHPAVLAGDNWLYSSDFPGYIREGMKKMIGSDVVTGFFNGCCGNVNHIDCTDPLQGRGFMMTQRIGYILAAASVESFNKKTPVCGDKLLVSRDMVRLKRIKITDDQLKWCKDTLVQAEGNRAPAQVDGLPDEVYARLMLAMHEIQDTDDDVEVMAVRIGDVGIIGLPGETFSELGMEIKKRSPAKHTIVITLANDSIGYLPTREAVEQGGYECSIGVRKYEEDAGEKLVESAVKQLQNLMA